MDVHLTPAWTLEDMDVNLLDWTCMDMNMITVDVKFRSWMIVDLRLSCRWMGTNLLFG